jgi:3-oxosteroid 1-dehydrogenase
MYHMRAQSHFTWDGTEYPNLLQVMIWDAPVAADETPWPWRFGVPLPGTDASHVIVGDTLGALAANVAERLRALAGRQGVTGSVGPAMQPAPTFTEQLSRTVEAFNAYASAGRDPEFHRGETPIEPAWQGPSRGALNTSMYPLQASGPYYALLLAPGTLDSCGGPVVDTSSRVLRTDGSVVPGLYGAGNCIASPAGQGYWSGGATISPAMVTGYLAGLHAASTPARDA